MRTVIDPDDQVILNDSDQRNVYFKMQYLRGGYGSSHIHPGGYICLHPALYRYRWNWRRLRSRATESYDVHGRLALPPTSKTFDPVPFHS